MAAHHPTAWINQLLGRQQIDLSHSIDSNIPLWSEDPKVVFTQVADYLPDGYFLRSFTMGEHSGTHLNASKSFIDEGDDIASMQRSHWILPAVCIDIREAVDEEVTYQLTVGDILRWEQHQRPIRKGEVLLVLTGWSEYWLAPKEYFNVGADGIAQFPSVSQQAVEFLIHQREIAGLGIDTHGLDSPHDNHFGINQALLSNQKLAIENLAHLDQLPAADILLLVAVLKLVEGSGCPSAITAII
ncbi:cyclase family protein [Spartinivicinus ruber]|uniref:cyclase family protein n=1 Tax=Spartinivicinus ruber TaxID=2683272 RepID=UPI0013CFE92A|nr:cyclase family protein [Spartinivicinus ruber]